MLDHLVLSVCEIVLAFIMIGALIVFMFAVREASLRLYERIATTQRRRNQIKNDIRQSRQHERLRNGNRSS